MHGRPSRTFEPAAAAAAGRGPRSSCAGSCRSMCTVAIARRRARRARRRSSRLGLGGGRAAVRRRCCWPPAPSPPRVTTLSPSGSSWAGSAAVEHPLWSSFVWRNEVVDTFVEMVAAPVVRQRRGRHAVLDAVAAEPRAPRSAGACGARPTGCPRPTWCGSATASTVNRGCVLQTHLFHDRVMSMGTVDLGHGATLGPHGVILPGRVDRRGRHGRARVAGDARRARAGRHPLGRQPDRPVDRSAERRCRDRRPRPAPSASTTPTCPGDGNGGYDVTHYDLDLDYRVDRNRLDRPGAASRRRHRGR